MKELKAKVQVLIDQYDSQLSQKGLKILIAKRYFETKVGERSGSPIAGQEIFNTIDRARNCKKEKANGYNYERNRYHCIVISVIPADKNLLSRDECRDYAFVLRKVERAHIGQKPRRIAYEEEKILSKIEKRILKILKKAERLSLKKICKDNIFDAIRYSTLTKYKYKSSFLGKERLTWEMIFLVVFCALLFGGLYIAWRISI